MRQKPILMYHWFLSEKLPASIISPQLEITQQLFKRQMQFLRQKGYQTVTLKDLVSKQNSPDLPVKPIVLTFDDGTLDFWEYAKPILEKYGFTATLFIVTGYVGRESRWDQHLNEPSRPLMSWEQITRLHKDGFEICSHTHTHRNFTELKDEEVWSEATKSSKIILEKLGHRPEYLAYPKGSYKEHHKKIIQEAGYKGACAVVLKWRDLLHSDSYELKRMTIKGTEPMMRFKLRLGLSKIIQFSKT